MTIRDFRTIFDTYIRSAVYTRFDVLICGKLTSGTEAAHI